MRLCPYVLGTLVTVAPAFARASDHIEVVVTERDREEIDTRVPGTAAPPGDTRTRTVQVIEHGDPIAEHTTWLALSLGVVTTPLTQRG
ncbi:MAG: hypothetical protein IAG13_31735, partial [Deltaproteobacteria bacterium]|nr:hypothetical protein [Nannocystaceae bacterium]